MGDEQPPAVAAAPVLGNIATVTKLDKTNYKDWVEEIEIELKLRSVYKALTDDNVDEMTDLQARRIILETMDKEHRAQVRGYTSAKEIMDRLKISYAEATDARKYRTLVKFFRYVKELTDDINGHIGKLEDMRADLLDLDFEIGEDIFLAIVIRSQLAEMALISNTITSGISKSMPNLDVNMRSPLKWSKRCANLFMQRHGPPVYIGDSIYPELTDLSEDEIKEMPPPRRVRDNWATLELFFKRPSRREEQPT